MLLNIQINGVKPLGNFGNSAREISMLNTALKDTLYSYGYAVPEEGGYLRVEILDG